MAITKKDEMFTAKPQNAPPSDALQSRRRRALFPSDEQSPDSGLGPISPIKFGSDSEDEEYIRMISKQVDSFTFEANYDILETTNTNNNVQSTPSSSVVMSSLLISPLNAAKDSLNFVVDSPSSQMKTPQEFSDNSKIPKLTRKSSLDSTLKEIVNSPENKENNCQLGHNKSSKVRTALFPDIKIYPKIGASKLISSNTKTHKSLNQKQVYLCSRRKNSGFINAGVRHKIKKPKAKKNTIDKKLLINAALNIMENSPLNDILNKDTSEAEDKVLSQYLNDLKEIQKDAPKLIDHPNEKGSRKRAHSSDLEPLKSPSTSPERKKFFKNKTCNLNKSLCDLTSDLAINSPKKTQDKKLFSIFYPGNKVELAQNLSKKNTTPKSKKFKKLDPDQMLLDAGQKRFGATQCHECKIVYHMGDPSDEIMHLNYHNSGNVLKYHGWKNERVVQKSEQENTKILQIIPNDPKTWWKKIKDVVEIVNRDLGFYEIQYNTENSQVFIYVKNRTIIGVLVAEVKSEGFKLLTGAENQADLCSEEAAPIKCGVSRVWVHKNNRKQGVASALMNSLKTSFMHGYILRNEDIAFSSPTEMGKIFGTNYFKTPHFLIYY